MVEDADIAQLDEYDNLSSVIVAPAIFPPVNNTCEPVTSPLCLTLKLLDEINTSFAVLEADIAQFVEYDNLSSDYYIIVSCNFN